MTNIIAIDVASEVSAVCVVNARGKVVKEANVPTRISVIKGLIRKVPRPRQVVFEEGTQAAWLWSELHGICDDVFVCDPRAAAGMSGQFKNDRNDARNLARQAQGNLLKRVWHGGKELQSLRESVRAYQNLTEENVRLKNQLKAVYRGCGIRIGKRAYSPESRKTAVTELKMKSQRERVQQLGKILDAVTIEREKALKLMIKNARGQKGYRQLRRVDGIGPIFTAMFLAEIGDPHRFRTHRQLWSYSGLAVMTHDSSEFELRDGVAVRKVRAARTRGLVTSYNRTLKCVFKQAALTLSRTKWQAQYRFLLEHSKNKNNALLTLARKLACVMLHIAKTGEQYDITKVFKAH